MAKSSHRLLTSLAATQGALLEPPALGLPLIPASGSQLPVSSLREPEEGRNSHRCDYSGRKGLYLLAKVLEASLRVMSDSVFKAE